jgi:uncharacterized protein YciI
MQFLILATDKAGQEDIRDKLRQIRLRWLDSNKGRIVAAGGMVDDHNRHVNGGLLIIDAKNRSDAEKFANEDPFMDSNLYETVRVVRWRRVFFDYQRIVAPDPFAAD